MQLTEHFSLEELTASKTAAAHKIVNTPDAVSAANLKVLADGLEQVRGLLNAPIDIHDGYRCPALNKAVGGVPNSAHAEGYAADFVCPGYGTPLEIVEKLQNAVVFDQLIQEGTWVHISFAPTLRKQVLTAHFVDGKATYTRGC